MSRKSNTNTTPVITESDAAAIKAQAYAVVLNATREAVRNTESVGFAWVALGRDTVAPYYGTREAFEADRVNYTREGIAAALSDAEWTAYRDDIPRANGKAFKDACAKDSTLEATCATRRAAKKAAIKKASEYFTRIGNYAFGKPAKDDSTSVEQNGDGETADAAPQDPTTRAQKALTAAILAFQKLDCPAFDVGRCIAMLQEVAGIAGAAMPTESDEG